MLSPLLISPLPQARAALLLALTLSMLCSACSSKDQAPVDAGADAAFDRGTDAPRGDGKPPVRDTNADGRTEPGWGCPFPYTVPQTRELPGTDAGFSSGPTSATDIHVRCQIQLDGAPAEVLVKAEPVKMGDFAALFEAREAFLCQGGEVEPLSTFFFDAGGRHAWKQMETTISGKRFRFGYSETCVGARPCTPFFDEYDVLDADSGAELATAQPTICAGVGPGGVPQPLVPQVRLQTAGAANEQLSFAQGSTDGDVDEQPVHEVTTTTVRMDLRETTNEEFALFLTDNGNDCDGQACAVVEAPGFKIKEDGAVWQAEQGFADHPVVQVTWYGAAAYCAWRRMILPSELTWEAAASAMGKRRYPWGEGSPTCDLAPHDQCAKTAPDLPCSHPTGNSIEGICDLSGNLAEWVGDWYQADFYQQCSTSNMYSCWQGPPVPTGLKVIRGGSFARPAHNLRAADRDSSDPQTGADDIGLRCMSSNPSF